MSIKANKVELFKNLFIFLKNDRKRVTHTHEDMENTRWYNNVVCWSFKLKWSIKKMDGTQVFMSSFRFYGLTYYFLVSSKQILYFTDVPL